MNRAPGDNWMDDLIHAPPPRVTLTCIHGPWHGRRVTDAGEFFVPVSPDPPARDREWPRGCYVKRGAQYVWEGVHSHDSTAPRNAPD